MPEDAQAGKYIALLLLFSFYFVVKFTGLGKAMLFHHLPLLSLQRRFLENLTGIFIKPC
jgi:hypothetical protein